MHEPTNHKQWVVKRCVYWVREWEKGRAWCLPNAHVSQKFILFIVPEKRLKCFQTPLTVGKWRWPSLIWTICKVRHVWNMMKNLIYVGQLNSEECDIFFRKGNKKDTKWAIVITQEASWGLCMLTTIIRLIWWLLLIIQVRLNCSTTCCDIWVKKGMEILHLKGKILKC